MWLEALKVAFSGLTAVFFTLIVLFGTIKATNIFCRMYRKKRSGE